MDIKDEKDLYKQNNKVKVTNSYRTGSGKIQYRTNSGGSVQRSISTAGLNYRNASVIYDQKDEQ